MKTSKKVNSLIHRLENGEDLYQYELHELAKACRANDETGELKPIRQGMTGKDMVVYLKTGKKRFSNKPMVKSKGRKKSAVSKKTA